MNIYKVLNEITLYIDNNLENKIDYNKLAKIMGVSTYTMQRIFSVITGIPIAEYIRKRKLSRAAYDLVTTNSKVMDIAIKYGYENGTSFSRAFELFHNIKPSEVKNSTNIKDFPRIIFDENIKINNDIEYSVVEMPNLTLYGQRIKTNNENINRDAPAFFKEMIAKYQAKYGDIKYGLVMYKDSERMLCDSYYCLYDKPIPDFEKIDIPSSKWLKFTINSQTAQDIQAMSKKFYQEFFPSCKYNLKDIPEIEYYHDNITDFFVPIY